MLKNFWVCDGKGSDGKGCGAILVGENDGRVIAGTVFNAFTGDEQKAVLKTEDPERKAFCMKCLVKELGIPNNALDVTRGAT